MPVSKRIGYALAGILIAFFGVLLTINQFKNGGDGGAAVVFQFFFIPIPMVFLTFLMAVGGVIIVFSAIFGRR